jgi:carboxymethylenebutenolidase
MLPRILPTGKYVELPLEVVMKFKGDRIVHEHIY